MYAPKTRFIPGRPAITLHPDGNPAAESSEDSDMNAIMNTKPTAAQAADVFFRTYARRDVPAMVALFAPGGIVEYVPLHLEGPVEQIGPGSWGVLIDAFPDLDNEVKSIVESADGRKAYVDVYIGGGQVKDAFGITNQGKRYWLRHMFVFHTDAEGRIERVTSYWDSVDWYTQLGKTTL
jgi:ketosteroid isomerase-like protein